MRTQTTLAALAVCLTLPLVSGCKRSSPSTEKAATAPTMSETLGLEATAAVHPDITAKHEISQGCQGALGALASCALAKSCDEETVFYLPAASRDALIALETSHNYSATAFARYCLSSCKSRSAEIDEATFIRDVCGAHPVTPAAGNPAVLAKAFSLRGQVEIEAEGVPLTKIIEIFGKPTVARASPYDCDSAFDEGPIEEHVYPSFIIETDGSNAVVRSMQMTDGNTVRISDGQILGTVTEMRFRTLFGARVQQFGQANRISASADGSMESAYDFYFNPEGILQRVDYFIGC